MFEITLSATRKASVEEYNGKATIRVSENGRRTPGSWYAETIGSSAARIISIDFGQGWNLTEDESARLIEFARIVASLECDCGKLAYCPQFGSAFAS